MKIAVLKSLRGKTITWPFILGWLLTATIIIGLAATFLWVYEHYCPSTAYNIPQACTGTPTTSQFAACQQYRTLIAAEASALSTQCYTALTAIGLATSSLALIGLGLTLLSNFKALSVAETSMRIAEQHGRAQVRAYVTVSDMSARISRDGTLTFRAVFKNTGQSPANGFYWKMTAYHARDMSTNNGLQTLPREVVYENDQIIGANDIASHDELNQQIVQVIPEILNKNIEPQKLATMMMHLTVDFEVSYIDVFNFQHTISSKYAGIVNLDFKNSGRFAALNRETYVSSSKPSNSTS